MDFLHFILWLILLQNADSSLIMSISFFCILFCCNSNMQQLISPSHLVAIAIFKMYQLHSSLSFLQHFHLLLELVFKFWVIFLISFSLCVCVFLGITQAFILFKFIGLFLCVFLRVLILCLDIYLGNSY